MLDSHQPGVGHWRERLEHCPSCDRDLVQPASYEPLWGDRWLISLHCPNCDWSQEGVWPHAALRRFEEHLDDVDERLWDELIRLEKERIEDEVAAFASVLERDLVLPEDF